MMKDTKTNIKKMKKLSREFYARHAYNPATHKVEETRKAKRV